MADAKKTATAGATGKDLPAPAPVRGPGLIGFIRETRREISKVTWPSWKETWLTTFVVFVMVGLTMVFFLGVDTVLNIAVRWLLGAGS